jgi:hypothetical protein
MAAAHALVTARIGSAILEAAAVFHAACGSQGGAPEGDPQCIAVCWQRMLFDAGAAAHHQFSSRSRWGGLA